jgi:hypothetical protein
MFYCEIEKFFSDSEVCMTNFFISYQQVDRSWAEWIAWHLEGAGYTTVVQAWDFRPGSNFVLEMQKHSADCERTVAVLSPAYLESLYTHPEWAAAFAKDPKGEFRSLIPIRVHPCKLTGLFAQIEYLDLVGQRNEAEAVAILLNGVTNERVKPAHKPSFPASATSDSNHVTPYFPNDPADAVPSKYTQLVRREFEIVVQRRNKPIEGSKSCELMFGHQFPFGTASVVPQISRCAVAYDVEQFLCATVGSYRAKGGRPINDFSPHIIYKAASTRWRLLVSLIADGLKEFDRDLTLSPLLDGLETKKREGKVSNRLRHSAREYARNPPTNLDYKLSHDILYLTGVACRENGITVSDVLAEEQNNYRYRTLHAGRPRSVDTQQSICSISVYFKDHRGAYDLLLRSLADRQINIVHSESWTLIPDRVAYTRITASFPTNVNLTQELGFALEAPPMHEEVYSFTIELGSPGDGGGFQ